MLTTLFTNLVPLSLNLFIFGVITFVLSWLTIRANFIRNGAVSITLLTACLFIVLLGVVTIAYAAFMGPPLK